MYKPIQRGEPTSRVVTYRPIGNKPLSGQENSHEQEAIPEPDKAYKPNLPGSGHAGFDELPANMKQAAIAQSTKEYFGPEVGIRLMAQHTDLDNRIDHSDEAGHKTLFNRQPQYPNEQEHSNQCNNDNYNAAICNAQRPRANELNPKVADDYAKSQQYLNKKRPVAEAS